ncbi:pyridoxal phosphate-dependent aminotransferase [Oceanispirochaeta crateris]|uniref:Aminotransferase n=1 Tax=Oceanispirochaeta crateris TaxID=2518645 RepID=A0A5C1QQ48_9SPIO|nr:pyridoxal phosphate-dependent aminotransferase [Oceanispirochaeta crateris]QEN09721.1 pyridoxal phosphate-dependent aminotransferase [Oceanispirochaeta crateris]
MAVSKKIQEMQASSSFIRKMFETGAALKSEFGAENVYDFSIGNPSALPPAEFTNILLEEAARENMHGYMPNAGYPEVRSQVAAYLTDEQNVKFRPENILMTSGAGGALNVALKTILNPGDKVLASKPCFMEYQFYCDNHGGGLELVDCLPGFDLNIEAFESVIDEKTAAVIVNSPNNPSGKVYSEKKLKELAELLERKSVEMGRRIYILCDEPYRKIIYGQVEVPSIPELYPHTMICTSYSKDLSIPGERIGFLAIAPGLEDRDHITSGAVLCNRILGYVNASSLMQRVVGRLQGMAVDVAQYQKKRDLLGQILTDCGFDLELPEGTFYLFPRAPLGDDMMVVNYLQEQNILAVPGRGFGMPGYFRLSYCVNDDMILRSEKAFKRAAQNIFG